MVEPRGRLDALADRSVVAEVSIGRVSSHRVGSTHPDGIQEPLLPKCTAWGLPTEHLLTIASWEWDGAFWWRWMPPESELPAGMSRQVWPQSPSQREDWRDSVSAS